MKKIFNIHISLFIFLSFTSCIVNEIKENKGITIGQISGGRKGYRGGYQLNYTYRVNGKVYSGESSKIVSSANFDTYLYKYFPVAYSTISPDKSILLVHPDQFEYWGLQFPDSLYWVRDKLKF